MSDGVEIERKFLVSEMPEGLEDCPATEIVQGYLCLDRAQEVRLRASGGRHLQTVKGTGELERFEVEVEITAEVFAALWPATRGRRVEKTRYRVPAGEHVIDVDVYRGALSGLVTAEVEAISVAAAERFQPPPWLGPEVTSDPRYKNRHLAVHGLPGGE